MAARQPALRAGPSAQARHCRACAAAHRSPTAPARRAAGVCKTVSRQFWPARRILAPACRPRLSVLQTPLLPLDTKGCPSLQCSIPASWLGTISDRPGMDHLLSRLRSSGGVASVRALGVTPTEQRALARAAARGVLVRARRGVYAIPDLPADVVHAAQLGGSAHRTIRAHPPWPLDAAPRAFARVPRRGTCLHQCHRASGVGQSVVDA